MRSLWIRVCTITATLYLCLPAVLSCQTRFVIRPDFEDLPAQRRALFPQKILKRPRVALVLSGGGARGAAQIGVLRVLERHRIPVDFICGTSFGAIIGGLYASGYSITEIESLALHTNWDDILSLTDESSRTELFVDQKQAYDRSFLVVRFQGLAPVIPPAVSSGQRLTDFISNLTLQALYHPYPSFDDLKIRFRCVATDLVSGRRIVIKDGSLWEALRATSTVPLLFSPVEKDSMQLIDGGLLANIPVDVAKDEGYDVVIAVNSSSGLRKPEELKAPWQTADQIMGIMMQLSNEVQLKRADIVITPPIGKHLASNFAGLDTLIAEGERAAELKVEEIQALVREKAGVLGPGDTSALRNPVVEIRGEGIPDSLRQIVGQQKTSNVVTVHGISSSLSSLYDVGDFKDVYAEIVADSVQTRILYTVVQNPRVQSVTFAGCNVVTPDLLREKYDRVLGRPLNYRRAEEAERDILRVYRSKGYSFARLDSAVFDERTGALGLTVNEGVIRAIDVQGGVRTRDEFVLQDFPLGVGDVFQIDKAKLGINSINGSRLFEYVYLEVSYVEQGTFLTIRLRERPSQLVRFGFRADNERGAQGSIDIRDENFRGSGMELGMTLLGGGRNQDAVLEYRARRLFGTSLSFNVSLFYGARNSYVYVDAPYMRENHWDRTRVGEYRDVRYGGRLTFGNQLERLGSATVDLSLQDVRIKDLDNAGYLEDHIRLGLLRFGTIIDTKDRYPFPTTGIGMDVSYELAGEALGSQVGYNVLRLSYEWYSTWGSRHTVHPKLSLGFADRTMPFAQQFRIGGQGSFFGLHEDDRHGRQFLLANIEYRYRLPIRIVFDTYFLARFDMATISSQLEEIKFNTLRYGVGGGLSLDTPIGPADFGMGRSFYFGKDLPENPVQQGPLLFYFMIGYQL